MTTLKMLREQAGLTQAQLGARVGTTQSVISALESGARSNLTLSTAAKLAEALGVSIDVLGGTLGAAPQKIFIVRRVKSPDKGKIVAAYDSKSEAERAAASLNGDEEGAYGVSEAPFNK